MAASRYLVSQKVIQYIFQIAVFFESVGVVLNIKNTYLISENPAEMKIRLLMECR